MSDPMGYDFQTDRELLESLNRKADRVLVILEHANDTLNAMVHDVAPLIESAKTQGVAGIVRSLLF